MQQSAEEGLTLLEVVFSMAILATVILSFINLFLSGYAASIQSGRISQAASLAQETMEELRACSYAELLAIGSELEVGSSFCPGFVSSTPEDVPGFPGFTRYFTITCDVLEFNEYMLKGLTLEVVVLQEKNREVARYAFFMGEK